MIGLVLSKLKSAAAVGWRMDGIQEGKKSHVTLLQEVRESTPLKFLKHGAPLYRKITTLATATTFRPFREKQLVNGQAFLLARLLVSSAQVLPLWGYRISSPGYLCWFTCSGRRQGVARIWSEKILKVLDSSTPRPRTESWHLLRAFSTRPRRP